MDFVGLYKKFRINRPLMLAEIERRLKQKIKVDVDPYYFWSAIRCNGTFLEISDKFYSNKGFATLGMLLSIPVGLGLVVLMCWIFISSIPFETSENRISLYVGPFAIVSVLGTLALCIWALCKDSFAHTHYPIRFNRKTRMVHVFRLNGTVLSAPWERLFFTVCYSSMFMGIRYWDLRAHVLDADGITVRETFALPRCYPDDTHAQQKALWEYIRCYMEDRNGVQETIARTPMYLPIATQRESWLFGLRRLLVEVGAGFFFLRLVILPVALPQSLGRWFAMRTSRIPLWPKEIEDVCQIEPNDPYERDERSNPADLWAVMKTMDWNGELRSAQVRSTST